MPQIPHSCSCQRGAAILIAMLVVAMVATFASVALWQQWRASEVEMAERTRVQAGWVLNGALDWSRLILREDGRTGGADHLAEPWAVALEEAKLTSFLAADRNITSDMLEGLPEAYMSGQILDAQAKLNARNLVEGGQPVASVVAAFHKLFQRLGLPGHEVDLLVQGLSSLSSDSRGTATGGSPSAPDAQEATSTTSAALPPQRLEDLIWLGLSSNTLTALGPYVTLLSKPTALNINTASAEVLAASIPNLDMAGASRLVTQRQARFFSSLAQAAEVIQTSDARFVEGLHAVATNYFEVRSKLRFDRLWIEERSLLFRDGASVSVVWRVRGAGQIVDTTQGR